MQFLNDLCRAPDTALVVISDCKKQGFAYCEDALRNSGYVGRIHPDWQAEDALPARFRRGQAVADWLARHPEVRRYVILDYDFQFYYPAQVTHLVPCDPLNGITYQNMKQSRHILQDEPIDPALDQRWRTFLPWWPEEPAVQRLRRQNLRLLRLSRRKTELWRRRLLRLDGDAPTLPQLTRRKRGGPKPAP